MTWWFGPLPPGLVTAAFPALAGILLREDDLFLIAVSMFLFVSDDRRDRNC